MGFWGAVFGGFPGVPPGDPPGAPIATNHPVRYQFGNPKKRAGGGRPPPSVETSHCAHTLVRAVAGSCDAALALEGVLGHPLSY